MSLSARLAAHRAAQPDSQPAAHPAVAGRIAAAGPGAPPTMMGSDPLNLARFGRHAGAALPDVLGGIGGLVPGPVGIALAGAGGVAGEAGRAALAGEPQSRSRMARAGAAQAGMTAAALGTGTLGRGAIKAALGRPGKAIAKKIVKHGLEPIEKTVARRGLHSREAAQRAIEASDRELRSVLNQARRNGITFDPGELARSVVDRVAKSRKYEVDKESKAELLKMTEKFLGDHPNTLSPEDLQHLKQRYQDLVFKGRADKSSQYVLTNEFNEAIRNAAKEALEGKRLMASEAEKKILRPVRGINRETSALMRAEEALADMAMRPPLRPFGAMGGGLNLPVLSAVGIPRGRALQAGLAASDPRTGLAVQNIPRLLHQLYAQDRIERE